MSLWALLDEESNMTEVNDNEAILLWCCARKHSLVRLQSKKICDNDANKDSRNIEAIEVFFCFFFNLFLVYAQPFPNAVYKRLWNKHTMMKESQQQINHSKQTWNWLSHLNFKHIFYYKMDTCKILSCNCRPHLWAGLLSCMKVTYTPWRSNNKHNLRLHNNIHKSSA